MAFLKKPPSERQAQPLPWSLAQKDDGLPYATLAESPTCPFELLAAPVLHGERYQHRTIYFSDVIARRESSYTSFDDLHGCAWACNQKESHSSIPPVVIAKSIDQTLKRNIQQVLLTMHEDPQAANALRSGAIERFVQVCDEDYHTTSSARFRL
jgi:ABC-type phosphate/phosphonate transport system substrate-binding protein